MTNLVDKVAEALMAHLFIPCNHASIGSEDHCRCGARPRGQMEWTQHAAQAVIDALELTAETRREEVDTGRWGTEQRWVTYLCCEKCGCQLVLHRLPRESTPRWHHAIWYGPEDNMVSYHDDCLEDDDD